MGIRKAFTILGMVALSWLFVLGTVYLVAKVWALFINAL
jgi:hypothetical protein